MTHDPNVPENDEALENPGDEQPDVFAVSRDENKFKLDRRTFLGVTGVAAAGAALAAATDSTLAGADLAQTRTPRPTRTPVVSPTPSAPWTVSTSRSGVYVFVGPGRHRGIRAYMPVDEEIAVLAKGKAPDGVFWWKIELPDVDQAWVDPEDVEISGDCNAVIDVDAPPFVPARDPQPTAAPSGTPVPAGNPGSVAPGQTGINYVGPGGTTFTLPCGSPLPAGAVCTCNCVSVPAPCSCDGACSCAGASHYWYPN